MFFVYADCMFKKKDAHCKVFRKIEKHRLYYSICLDYEINSALVTRYLTFFF